MDDQMAELKTALEDMQSLMIRLVEITRRMEQEMKEKGEITMDFKKEVDDTVYDCEDYCKKVEALTDVREMPM